MNRPLKFRVWDKKLNKFTLGYDDDVGYFEEIYSDPPGIFFAGLRFLNKYSDRYIIQQYTGLTDKNDKEIYEGDIVKFSRLFEKERKIKELKSFVRFDEGKFGFDLIGFNGMFYDLSYECRIEVIGNIFEHSELLK